MTTMIGQVPKYQRTSRHAWDYDFSDSDFPNLEKLSIAFFCKPNILRYVKNHQKLTTLTIGNVQDHLGMDYFIKGTHRVPDNIKNIIFGTITNEIKINRLKEIIKSDTHRQTVTIEYFDGDSDDEVGVLAAIQP